MINFGRAVKKFRDYKGMDITAFAEALSLTPQDLESIESGITFPDNFGIKLKDIFNMTEDEWQWFINTSRDGCYETRKLPLMTRKQKLLYTKLRDCGVNRKEAIRQALK